ncbi:hypothetical protein Bca4012_058677 [Brassica carinata]
MFCLLASWAFFVSGPSISMGAFGTRSGIDRSAKPTSNSHSFWDVSHPIFEAHSSSIYVPQRYISALVAVSLGGTTSFVGSSRFKNKPARYRSVSARGRVGRGRIQQGHFFRPAGPPVPSHINVMSSLESDCNPLSELYKLYGGPTELENLILTPSEHPWDAFTVLWCSMSLSMLTPDYSSWHKLRFSSDFLYKLLAGTEADMGRNSDWVDRWWSRYFLV